MKATSTRRNLSTTFRRTRRLRFTPRTTLPTFAAAPTFQTQRKSTLRPLSLQNLPEPIGAATATARCSLAFTPSLLKSPTTLRTILKCWKRPKSATTAALALRWTCSTLTPKTRARFSGIQTDGQSTPSCRTTCERWSAATVTLRSTLRPLCLARFGSEAATGATTKKICSSPNQKSACSRLSR